MNERTTDEHKPRHPNDRTDEVNSAGVENPAFIKPDRRAQLAPMVEFYEALRQPLPPAIWVDASAMPDAARALLVHDNDMTPTLERWYGDEMTLRTLDRHVSEKTLSRMVVLETVCDSTPAEFGMIRIHLDRFADVAREEIIDCHIPLGTILGRRKITHTCQVGGYISIASDALMNRALDLNESTQLWGRCNLLLDQSNRALAEVVEILAPVNQSPSEEVDHDKER